MAAIGHRLQRRNSMKCEEEEEPVHLEHYSIFNKAWEYRGEGNANVVIALPNEMRVVRLSKSELSEAILGGLKASHRRKIEREVQFANYCFGPLLGLEFVEKVRAIRFLPQEIQLLDQYLKNIRPVYRLHKELKIPFATLHSDYAMINSSTAINFCVEIKPKQGWWPKSASPEASPYCTYCLNQFLKLTTSKITQMTQYCPLDLFSGEAERMILSVIALIENPQNNLRIFRDGKLVYGDGLDESIDDVIKDFVFTCDNESAKFPVDGENTDGRSRSFNNLIYLLCLALIKPKKTVIGRKLENELFLRLKHQLKKLLSHSSMTCLDIGPGVSTRLGDPSSSASSSDDEAPQISDTALLAKRECQRRGKFLPPGSILSRILFIQKLGQRGISSIYELFRKICPIHQGRDSPLLGPQRRNNGEVGIQLDEENLEDEDWRDLCPGVSCLAAPEKWLDDLPELKIEDVQALEHYLLAATAKDCSIMVTFSPVSTTLDPTDMNCLTLKDLNGGMYRVRIGVADLDPKPLKSIVRHYLRDKEMARSYAACLRKIKNV